MLRALGQSSLERIDQVFDANLPDISIVDDKVVKFLRLSEGRVGQEKEDGERKLGHGE